jgi:hypothetical protein
MYSNIPTTELKSIIENTLKTKHTDEKQKDVTGIYDIIITQNYSTHNDTFFSTNKWSSNGISFICNTFEIISAIY